MADPTQGSAATAEAEVSSVGSQPAPGADAPQVAAPSPETPPDYEAMFNEERAKRTAAENETNVWRGRSKNVVTRDELADVAGQMTLLRKDIRELTDPSLRPEEREVKVAALEADAEHDEQHRTATAEANELLDDMDSLLADAGIAKTDDRLKEADALWNEANKPGNLDMPKMRRAFRLVARIVADHNQAQAASAAASGARKQNQEDLDQSSGGAGAGSGKTQFTAADIAAMTPEEYEANREHLLK